jgi:hypothetical protein
MKSQKIIKFIFCIAVFFCLMTFSYAHEGHDHDHDHDHGHNTEEEFDHTHEHQDAEGEESGSEAQDYALHIQHTLSGLGYDKLESINKQQFRTFFEKMVFMEEEINSEERELMERIYDRLTHDLPVTIPIKDVGEIVRIEKIYTIINEISESLGLNNNATTYEDFNKELEEMSKSDL